MQISIKHGLTFLANPKCGTTSIESALKGRCEINISGTKIGKHLNAHKYLKIWEPFLKSQYPRQTFFIICTTRDPISKLISWYQYRSRSKLIRSPKYLGNTDFKEWCESKMLESTPADHFFYDHEKDKLLVDIPVPISQFKRLDHFLQSTVGSRPFRRKNESLGFHPKSYAYNIPREQLHAIAMKTYDNLPEENLFRQSVERHQKIENYFQSSKEQDLRILSNEIKSYLQKI